MKHLYLTLAFVVATLAVAGFVFWRYFYLATIIIDPIPTDATVTLDGKATPERTLRVKRGRHQIRVSAEGYQAMETTVDATLGSQYVRRFELVPLPRPTKLLDGPIRSVRMAADGQSLFYAKDGTLFIIPATLDKSGLPAVPITPPINELTAVEWAPDFSLAIVHKQDEVGLYDFKKYDLLHQEYRRFDSAGIATAWTADGTAIVAETELEDRRLLVRRNRAGGEPTNLSDLTNFPLKDISLLTGPGNLTVISSQSAESPNDILLFDIHQRLIIPLTDSGRAMAPVLSADRSLIAYLDNGELVTAEISGKNKRNHALRPQPTAYSFIGKDRLAVITPNNLTIINLQDGSRQSTEIFAPSGAIRQLMADSDGKLFHYLYQDSLYRLILK